MTETTPAPLPPAQKASWGAFLKVSKLNKNII